MDILNVKHGDFSGNVFFSDIFRQIKQNYGICINLVLLDYRNFPIFDAIMSFCVYRVISERILNILRQKIIAQLIVYQILAYCVFFMSDRGISEDFYFIAYGILNCLFFYLQQLLEIVVWLILGFFQCLSVLLFYEIQTPTFIV